MNHSLNQLLECGAESLVICGMLLYPGLLEQLISKVAQKQINSVFKKNFHQGYQMKSWKEILNHEVFVVEGETLKESHGYDWLLQKDDKDKENLIGETLQKMYEIFIARSSALFTPDYILQWLKEVIGFTLNKLDEQTLDRDLFIAKISSMVESPFGLSRYMSLKKSDFTDDITTINANELL